MPKPKTFARKDVDRVRALLQDAPEKPKQLAPLTAKEMVTAISAEIRELQKRNYTLEEIAEMIRKGFDLDSLGASTLKQYLQKKRKPQNTARATTKKA